MTYFLTSWRYSRLFLIEPLHLHFKWYRWTLPTTSVVPTHSTSCYNPQYATTILIKSKAVRVQPTFWQLVWLQQDSTCAPWHKSHRVPSKSPTKNNLVRSWHSRLVHTRPLNASLSQLWNLYSFHQDHQNLSHCCFPAPEIPPTRHVIPRQKCLIFVRVV